MSSTINQLLRNRIKSGNTKKTNGKIRRSKIPFSLKWNSVNGKFVSNPRGNPQRSGVCRRIFIMNPRKPNSAKRPVAEVAISNGRKRLVAHIPGIGHNLREFSRVLVSQGRTKDLSGVKFKIIRGHADTEGVQGRKSSRSRYGVKMPS